MFILGYRIPMFASLIVWCILWELAGQFEWVDLFPPFSSVLVALVELFDEPAFYSAAWDSLQAFCYAMLIAISGGIFLGFLMGRIESANKLLGMWVNIFASAPLSSLVPVLVVLLGLGQTTIIVTVVLFSIWIITLDTYAGVRHISKSLIEMGNSFGATRWQMLTKILFWAALPEILAGIRMGLIRAVKGVVVGELLVSVVALGALFTIYSRGLHLEKVWALTLVLFAFALSLATLIGKVEQKVEYYAGTRG